MANKPGPTGTQAVDIPDEGTRARARSTRPAPSAGGTGGRQAMSYALPLAQTPQPATGPGPLVAQVYFATNEAELDRNDRSVLDQLSRELFALNVGGYTMQLAVVGNADHRGPGNYNQRLARRRAESVAGHIGLAAGFEAVKVYSAGETAAQQPGRAGRVAPSQLARDRRVDIFLVQRRATISMEPMTIEADAPSQFDRIWAGLAKSHSGDLFIVGSHDLTGKIYNLGDGEPVKNAWININGWKLGAGLGASVSAVFVIAHGYRSAPAMNGVAGGWDFDVAIGLKLGDFLKGVKGLGKVIDSYEKYKKMRYLTENAIKNLGITEPGVYSIPIPFAGTGLHVWGGYKFGDVKVTSVGTGVP